MLLAELIQDWETAKKLEGLSPNTLENRRIRHRYVLEFLGNVPLEEVSTGRLRDLVASRNLAPNSARVWVASIRSLFSFAVEEGYLEESPAARLKYPRYQQLKQDRLTQEQLEVFLSTPIRKYPRLSRYREARDRCWFHVAVFTGLRACEIVGLDMQDVDLGERVLHVRKAKGVKYRALPLVGVLVQELETYLPHRRAMGDGEEALFLHTYGGRASEETYYRAFQRHLATCGLPRMGTHATRRSFATLLHEQTGDPYSIMQLMGHSQLKTTLVYCTVSEQRKREAIEMHPLLHSQGE